MRLRNKITGVEGEKIREYKVTGAEVQIMVRTDAGRKYHAPKWQWEVIE